MAISATIVDIRGKAYAPIAEELHERNLETLRIGQDFQREESKLQREQAMEIVKMQMKYA